MLNKLTESADFISSFINETPPTAH